MRDIKFRAWDNLEKRMRKVVSLHWRDGKLISARLEGDNEPIPIEGRLEIEQRIGLKDKNGTEIYKSDNCSFTSKTGKHVGVVERSDDLASFGLRMVKNNLLYTFSELNVIGVDLNTLEIIGNIHENPGKVMTDEGLKTRIELLVDKLSFRISHLTSLYENKKVNSANFCKEASDIKSNFIKSIMKLVREHEHLLEE